MNSSARIFFFLGGLALLAAIIFPIVSHEPPGSAMLGIFALSMIYIGWELHSGRNTDRADDADAKAVVGPEHVFPSSPWPVVLAVAVAIAAVGIVFSPVVAAIGGAILLAAGAGWFLQRVHPGGAHEVTAALGHPVGSGTDADAGDGLGDQGDQGDQDVQVR